MPSLAHALFAKLIVRRTTPFRSAAEERRRLTRWQEGLDPSLPTKLTPVLRRRWRTAVVDIGFPVHVLTPRGDVRGTLIYFHGGGYVAPTDSVHVRYATRLAAALGLRVVLPDYPLAPGATWRDSHQSLVDLVESWAESGPLYAAGDSAGGGLLLAVAGSVRPGTIEAMVLHAPWVDLTTSEPDTFTTDDPWLNMDKLMTYAEFWAGSPDDLPRREVSPALHSLDGLPRALMFCGTRDRLVPGCRMLAARAATYDWELRYVEAPGLLHVFTLIPGLPEARRAFALTLDFLRE